jgi:tRNA threonylcarbamoyladenosine biosynthesis protein TsaB
MIILGIDTSTPRTSVAIVERRVAIAELQQGEDRRGRGADLLVLIDAVCVGAAIGPHDLDAVAIGAGPGSFTSLRIGMATAKGIAFAAHCPLWAVSSLAALADEALDEDPTATIVATLDARRQEIYTGAYRRAGEQTVLLAPERVMPPGELAAFMPPGAKIVGDAAEVLAAFPQAREASPTGAAVARLALAGTRVDVLVSGGPSYIRPSEAEMKYPDGVPGALRRR